MLKNAVIMGNIYDPDTDCQYILMREMLGGRILKISLYIPEGKKNIIQKLRQEESVARNIKDAGTRTTILAGLNKIMSKYAGEGKAYFTDSKELLIIPYNGKSFIYKCGRDYIYNQELTPEKSLYILIVMDANECTIGELRGKRITTIWHETSQVPRKHDAGGQSQVRFMQNRDLALKAWLKKCGYKLKDIIMGVRMG